MSPKSERILVRGVNWLGDAVMSTPALLRLREARPDAHITLLTHEKLSDLWLNHPAVDAVLTFAAGETIWSVVKKLRSGNFQIGLTLPDSHRSALELRLARIPQRIGYAPSLRKLLLTQPVETGAGFVRMRKRSIGEIRRRAAAAPPDATRGRPNAPPPAAHHLHRYLRLVAALGANPEPLPPFLAVTDGEVAAVKQKFSLPGDALWFGLNPGAEYGPAKRWPHERFIAVALEAQRRLHCRWLIFGGPADIPLAADIANSLLRTFPSAPPLNLAGRTTLRELCALLKLSRVMLTNDTGPMHVAAAVGTPVVAIFGSTSPELTAPGSPNDPRHRLFKSDAPCSPCFRRACPIDFRCMKGIETEPVIAAMLDAAGPHRPAGNIL